MVLFNSLVIGALAGVLMADEPVWAYVAVASLAALLGGSAHWFLARTIYRRWSTAKLQDPGGVVRSRPPFSAE
jgi:membrane protein YqaA with SNARE-associated domain